MPEPRDDHFTSEDRRTLTEVNVHMTYIKGAIEALQKQNDKDAGMELANHVALKAHVDSACDKLDNRVRILENFRWWLMGSMVVVGFGAGLLGRYLVR